MKIENKKIILNLPLSFAVVFFISCAATAAIFLARPATGIDVLPLIIESNGAIFFLNLLPVLITALLLFFVTSRASAACFASAFPFLLLSFVNRYMVAFRYAPLRPFDLRLGMEFLGVAKSIKPAVYFAAGAAFSFYVALFILAAVFVKNKKMPPQFRAAGTAACAAAALILNFTLYSNAGVYASLPYQGSEYNATDLYQSRGFVYSFLFDLNDAKISKPEFYERHRPEILAEEEKNILSGAAGEPRVNVIFVLSEAFSEIPLNPLIYFEGREDPLVNYKIIKEESFYGSIVVPHTGGGTADAEFDILTGINARDFRGVPYAFTFVTRPFPGVASALRGAGYRTLAMHPGTGWFYNRQNVYPLLGFEDFLSDDYFDLSDKKGMYVSERQTISKLMSEYERLHDETNGEPLFLMCITIQNHGPYGGKYGALEKNFNTELIFNAEETDALAQYFHGLADCDAELGRLADFLRAREEPALLVYFGDHLPSLPSGVMQALFPAPDEPAPGEQLLRYNRAPFIVWANETARVEIDFSASDLPDDKTISAHYLGAMIMELLGFSYRDPFLDFINKLRREYPVSLEVTFVGADGAMRVFDAENEPPLVKYKSWGYHRIIN